MSHLLFPYTDSDSMNTCKDPLFSIVDRAHALVNNGNYSTFFVNGSLRMMADGPKHTATASLAITKRWMR